jgi:FkbM family methyltransferase
LEHALSQIGVCEVARRQIMETLRNAELNSTDKKGFKDKVRWPIVQALLRECKTHEVELESGMIFEVSADSRIERALLLSEMKHPDHVWEPQTTKLLKALSLDATNVVVGGAYIGDQVVPMACHIRRKHSNTAIHAFEPMTHSFQKLKRNIELNSLTNVIAVRESVWDVSGLKLALRGDLALASSTEQLDEQCADTANSRSIDEYAQSNGIGQIGLIMLDTEGGELRALQGALNVLSQDFANAPNIIFEIHNFFVDWSNGLENTEIVRFLTDLGYSVFAIRDFHGNQPMDSFPIELIPADSVYLEGPPHGFNMLAVKELKTIDSVSAKVLHGVSPKLLLEKKPELHHPYFSGLSE